MAGSKTIQINLKAVADFNDVVNNAKQIQSVLEKLKLPDSLKANFTKIFADIDKNATKAAEAMERGFKTKGDVSTFEKTVNSINSSMTKLTQNMQKIDSESFGFGSLTGEINELDKTIKRLQNELNAISAQKLQDVTNAVKEGQKISKAGAWEDFFNAFKEGTAGVEDAQKAYNKLAGEVEKAKQRLGEEEFLKSEKWQNYARQVGVLGTALKDLNGTSQQTIEKKQELNAAYSKQEALKLEGAKEGQQNLDNLNNSQKRFVEEFNKMAGAATDSAQAMQQTNSTLDHFKQRIAYFFGAANAVNLFKRAIRSAFNTIKDLDKVMTETAVVTKFSVSDMWGQLPEYTKRANELGVSIHSAYESATIYYQQGLKTNEVIALSNQTLKMARIAGLDAADATDRMTNALRGFNMELNETNAERVADVYSKLAAMSASNVDEISTAMTKVASLASNANMQFETTAAFLSQIIETTRESAETAGTALKTVVARFSEVKKLFSEGELLGTDEEGEAIDVNKVSVALRSAGINLNEYLTGMKGLDDIFLELASKWDSLDKVQQRYIATMAAGSRQQSRFIAMMQDYGRTQELVNAANNAAGASNEQYQKTLDSLESKLNRLKNAWDEFLMGITNNTLIKAAVDALTGLLNVINAIISGISKITGPLQSFTKSVLSLVTVIGGLKIGKAIFNNIFASLGSTFMGKGKEAGTSFIAGFSSSASKIKNVFTKDFWVGIHPPKKIDTSSFDIAEKNLQELNAAKIQGVTATAQLESAERIYATELTALGSIYGLDAEQLQVVNLAKKFGVDTDIAAAAAKKGLTAEMIQENVLRLSSTEVTADEIRVKTKEMIATYGQVAAEEIENETTKVGILTRLKNITLLLFGTKRKRAEAIATLNLGKANAAAAASQSALNKAMAACPIGWILLLVVALVAAIVAVAKAIRDASPEAALERAKSAAEDAAEGANRATQAYKDLADAWEDLNNKKLDLSNLDKGSQEWKDQVQEINNKVMDLMKNYKELQVVFNKDTGLLEVQNYDYVHQLYSDRSQRARAISTQADINVEKKQQNVDFYNLSSKYRGYTQEENLYADANNSDAYIITYNKDITAEIAKRVASGELFTHTDIIDAFNEAGLKVDFDLEDENVIDELKAFGLAILNSEKAIDSYNEAFVASAAVLSTTKENAQQYLSVDFVESAKVKASAELDEDFKDLTDTKRSEYREQFAQAQGYADYSAYKKDHDNKDITDTELKAAIAASNAISIMSQQANNFLNIANSIKDKDTKSVFNHIISDQEDFTEKEQKIFLEAFEVTNVDDLISAAEEAPLSFKYRFEKLFGFTFDSLGVTIEDFCNRLKNESDALEVANSVANQNFAKFKRENAYDNVAGGVRKKVSQQLVDLESRKGIESVEEIFKILDDAEKNLSPDDFNKFMSAFSMLDLSDPDDIKNFSTLLSQVGISTLKLGKDFDYLESEIISAANAVKTFSLKNIEETLSSRGQYTKQIRDRSSNIFSREEMEEAITNGANAEDFEWNGESFTYIGGTMEQLALAIEQNTAATLQATQEELRNQVPIGITQMAESIKGFYENPTDWLQAVQENQGKNTFNTLKNLLDIYGITQLEDERGNLKNIEEFSINDLITALTNIFAKNEDLQTVEGYKTPNGPNAAQAINEGEQAGLDSTEIIQYAEHLQELTETQEETKMMSHDMATEIAKDNILMNQSLEELSSNWEEWKAALDPMLKGTQQYSTTLTKLNKNMQKLLGVNADFSENFLTSADNMELMERAANGDLKAITKLRAAAVEDIILHTALDEESQQKVVNEIQDFLNNVNLDDIKVGATLDTLPFGNALVDLINSTYGATEEAQQILNSLGFEPEVSYVDVPMESANFDETTSTYTYTDPITGEQKTAKVESKLTAGEDGMLHIPVINGSKTTFKGPPEATINASNRPASTGGSGGGGGGSSEKPSYWENPYDELYNLTEKINEAMRTREALEREYGKLLDERTTSTQQILKNSLEEIALLRQQLDYEKQMEAGRKRQIENIGSQMYTDDEGNRTAFSELGVMKYASYNFNTGLIQIDWSGLEEIANDASREEEGKQAEAYISKLEELVGQYEDVRDAVWEIEDKLEEIRKRSIDESIEFQQRIFDAIVSQKQAIIDSFDAMSQAIEETTSKVIDNVREQIQAERQQRQNEKTEEEISDKEARLAYLSRDTSGANQLETIKLQKEIDDARQNYSDSLIDQAIDQMQKDADLAAEQRAQQIQIMQAQLDIATENGEFWSDVKALLDDAFNPDGTLKEGSKLVALLKDTEAFKGMSEMGQDQWIDDMVQAWLTANEGLSNWKMKKAEEAGSLTLGNGTKLTYKDGKWTDGKNTYSDVGYDVQSGQFVGTNNKDYKPAQPSGGGKAGTGGGQPAKQEPTQAEVTDAIKRGVSAAVWNGNQGWDPDRSKKLKEVFGNGSVYSDIINYINAGVYSGDPSAFSYANMKKKNFKKYESGGLASYTGLAWLDGSRAKPEAILSAQDTKNFIALRDILAQFMGSGAVGGGSKSGDNYFDIDIQAEIGSDYDVDRLASQIKQQIYNDSTYRNVNAINYIR